MAASLLSFRWSTDLVKLARLTRDLPGFLRKPMAVDQAAEIVKLRLATRDQRFVRLVEQTVYLSPSSPYLKLLAWAGCELGDLKALVAADGLEGALSALLQSGVYLTFDEFKGRGEVVRGSTRLAFNEDEFDNPLISPHLEATSGGTRGPRTTVKLTLPYFSDLAANTALVFQMHGLADYEHVVWLQGFSAGFIYARLGHPTPAWFHPVDSFSTHFTIASWYITVLGWLLGRPIPPPTFLDVQDPGRLAAWLSVRRREGRNICVTTYASSAVRTCAVARDRGLDLRGVCFITIGEAFTEAKQRVVESVGARALVRYAFTEAGIIGYGCGTPTSSDDVHFLRDSYGLIQQTRSVGDGANLSVKAFMFTTLLSSCPKILLNVESGDYGSLERRDCGCQLGALGLQDHISWIRSFEKLSSEGMTFVQTDLLRVLEDVFPARFGGTSADYQVLEQEGADGILRLLLIVSPHLGPLDEQLMRQTFLQELERGSPFDRFSATMWGRAGTVEIRRQPPVATGAGKILPFHLVRAPATGATNPTDSSAAAH